MTEPLTVNQLGAVRREFRRLSIRDADREWRLNASALLLGLPGALDSTKTLSAGQAGLLYRYLSGFDDQRDLAYAVAAARRQRIRMKFLRELAIALSCHGY